MKTTWQKWTAGLLSALLVLGAACSVPSVSAAAAETNTDGTAASESASAKASAEQTVTMNLTAPETVAAGSSFDVKLAIDGLDKLDASIYVMQMNLTYPEGLTCAEVTPGENISGTLTPGIHNDQLKTTVVYDSDALDGMPKDADTLFTAKFKADESMEEGDYTIEMGSVMLYTADFDEIVGVLQNAAVHVGHQVAPEKADLTVTFNSPSAQLWIGGEEQRLANLIGSYQQKDVENGADLALDFVPTVEGRSFRSVTINGGEPVLIGDDAYSYTGNMDTLNPTLGFVFETVNKTTLGAVIDYAQERIDAGDTVDLAPTVKKKFEKAFETAGKVYENPEATQAEIDDAWSELMHMIHMLSFVSGDKTALNGLIETALTLDENDYLTSAWSDFETALTEAQEVAADDDALKNDVEKAYESLYNAMIALLESNRADRTELDEVIAQAEAINLDEYLDAGQDAFTEALEQAKNIGPDATQKEVDKAAEALSKALANLRKIPDRAELEDLLARMQAKNLSSYTSSSAAKYTAAANDLAAALANPDATPEELAAAEDAALLAEKNLQNKPHNSSKGSSGSSGTSRKPVNAYGEGGTAVVSPVIGAAQAVVEKAFVRSDTTLPFTLIRGSAYCFKMTVVNGENLTPNFTVGDGNVLKTQFIAKIGNDYYYRVYAIGTPGQSTGVYTTIGSEAAQKHCIVTIG